MTKKKHALSVFSLTMITVGSVDSIRNLPATALFGSKLIFFFLFGAIFFLIPTALVSAELSSSQSKHRGVYDWVKAAFGPRTGFVAIWLQWIENVIWYPTILSFVAGTVGYLINPQLVNNPIFLTSVIIAAFWGATFVNCMGMRSSATFSNICAISGLLLPMALIIGLGTVWIFDNNPAQIQFNAANLLPTWSDKSMWVSLTAVMMSFCGIEIATVHTNDVANPQSSFPKALAYSVIIILTTLILGSLSIAIVLPHEQINLVAGIMQAFDTFFARYHLSQIMPIIALMLILGGLGGVSNWIIAPTRGLLLAANDGHLPVYLKKTNKHNAPVFMLIGQAIIVTALSTMFLLMPSVNGSYWILTVLAAQLYMLMYILMFLAALKLRISNPKNQGSFQVPGGIIGLVSISIIGLTGCLATLIVGFIPPEGINVGSTMRYEISLSIGLFLMISVPLIISKLRETPIIESMSEA